MAKKKVNRQSNDYEQQVESEPASAHTNRVLVQTQTALEAMPTTVQHSETFERLKSLNGLLLKETTERRQQVKSLVRTKEDLQSELSRTITEKDSLKAELSKLRKENDVLEVQTSVLSTFVGTQLSDLTGRCDKVMSEKAEIESVMVKKEVDIGVLTRRVNELVNSLENERNKLSEVSQERDNVKKSIDGLSRESNRLKEKATEMKKMEVRLKAEAESMRTECKKLMEGDSEKRNEIAVVTREKELAVKKLTEYEMVIGGLKEKVDVNLTEKKEYEKDRNKQQMEIVRLEGELKKLYGFLQISQKEEEGLRMRTSELGKALIEGTEREKEMGTMIGALQVENYKMEQSMKDLKDENVALQKDLNSFKKEVENMQKIVDEIMRKKDIMYQLNKSKESEIIKLRDKVVEMNNFMLNQRESCRDLEVKNKALITDIDHIKRDLLEVKNERDFMRRNCNEHSVNVENLTFKVSELEKNLVQAARELSLMEAEKKELIMKNQAMDGRMKTLLQEKDMLQNSIREAKENSDDLKGKIEAAVMNSTRALIMLKDTAAIICQPQDEKGNEEVIMSERRLEEEIEPYAQELGAITNAFKNKTKMVEDMKEQLASLQNTVATVQKSKSFLTILSSATTVLAAASVAYVASKTMNY